MINREMFFDKLRQTVFHGSISQKQVDGINTILDEWEKRSLPNVIWLAYILATTYHETASTMQPIEEYGKGKSRPYGKINPETGYAYYGRGYVQLTWDYNYKNMGKLLQVDLYHDPKLALVPAIAVQIMFEGMIRGLFTGKRLGDYFNEHKEDWYEARRIINGIDKADLIAKYALYFFEAT